MCIALAAASQLPRASFEVELSVHRPAVSSSDGVLGRRQPFAGVPAPQQRRRRIGAYAARDGGSERKRGGDTEGEGGRGTGVMESHGGKVKARAEGARARVCVCVCVCVHVGGERALRDSTGVGSLVPSA